MSVACFVCITTNDRAEAVDIGGDLVEARLAACVNIIDDRVKTLHFASCPCVVALPVEGGNSEYLEWIAREIAAASADQGG